MPERKILCGSASHFQGDERDVILFSIGYGPDEELIRKNIAQAGMEDRVILLGKKVNPYPYFKACDFYICFRNILRKSL